jgi:hypothetical protein
MHARPVDNEKLTNIFIFALDFDTTGRFTMNPEVVEALQRSSQTTETGIYSIYPPKHGMNLCMRHRFSRFKHSAAHSRVKSHEDK